MIGLATLSAAALSGSLYVASLYNQLKTAFLDQQQFIPTRIYSDLVHLTPSQSRHVIDDRLRSLGYDAARSNDRIQFKLHPIDYPVYLLPENHPTQAVSEQEITLQFDGSQDQSLLQAIVVEGKEIPDLYLEPEIIATLSQSGSAAAKAIRSYVKFSEIPSLVWRAIIAIEDQHFMEHRGIDPKALARAVWVNLRTRSFAQGGSTITQQLVKNLLARKKKDLLKKAPEIFLAPLLEGTFSKEQILERYLNEVYLGQVGQLEVRGIAEGAELFFGKKLEDLNLAEISLIAGLIKGPGFYSPYTHRARAVERQKLVLKRMVETQQIAPEEAALAIKQAIRLAPPQNFANKAPYFSDYVKAELLRQVGGRIPDSDLPQAGLRVYSTLDMNINSSAQRTVTAGVNQLEKNLKLSGKDRLEGALACVDHNTGFIRALVGGRSYAQSNFNRILNMRRQVGSTFKPFVYLTAYIKGRGPSGAPYSPAYPLEDAPWKLNYDHGKQEWSPKNYEKEFMGWITLRTALSHSVNTVAAKLGIEVGLSEIIKTARELGIESELPEVPSLSLGVAEMSPVELLRAYSVIANHGEQNELTVIRAITQEDGTAFARFISHPKAKITAAAADLITDTMQSVFTEGTAKSAHNLGFERPAAGKTGTTSNHRDAWFAGYTPQLTTVVWVGQDQTGSGKIVLTGATSALPIWTSFMNQALESEPPQNFHLSSELIEITFDRRSGYKASASCPASQSIADRVIRDQLPSKDACETGWPASPREINN